MTGWQQISDTDHHGGAYLTSTALKAALKSPAHYRLHMEGKTADKAAFAFGRAAHSRILEPWDYPKRYASIPAFDRRTKVGKADWATWLEDNDAVEVRDASNKISATSKTREFLSGDDMATIEAMAQSVASNPDASRWLNPEADDNFTEQSGIVMDERYGLLACRPDLRVIGDYIVDLKTCASADPDYMSKALVNFGYALSAAWYVDVARRVDGHEYRFIWVMVEKTAPYAVACYEADPQVLAYGRENYNRALEVIAECADNKQWPASYHSGTPFAELPRWAK
jgi:hypothetical protein